MSNPESPETGWAPGRRRKDRIRYAIALAITAAAFVVLFRTAPKTWEALSHPHWPTLAGAVALTALFPFCMALRWAAVLWAVDCPAPYRETLWITMGAWPLGALTPSKTGDLAKAFCVRDRAALPVGLGSVVMERALDVITLFLFSLCGAIALRWWSVAGLAAAGLCAAAAGWTAVAHGWRLPLGPKWSERLERFGQTSRALVRRPRYLALSAAWAALNWLFSVWQTQLLYHAFGARPPFFYVCAALPVAIFIGLLPATVAGMGTRDGALIALFARIGIPAPVSLSVGIWYSLAGYWLPSLAGIPFMLRLVKKMP